MKKIILSFDYELFFGDQSGTVQKTLIEPTNLLMDVMEDSGFRGDFFIDALMLKYLKEVGTERTLSDYNLIQNQIMDMIRRGHRIELHLHPHWVDAIYNGDGTWDYSNFEHYSLNSFGEDEIIKMFEECSDILLTIARKVDPDYKLCAFRAGGWAVQPFGKLKKAFINVGVNIDSSVSNGMYNFLKDSYYDFRQSPQKEKYRFDDDVCVEKKDGLFREIPISSAHIPFFLFLYNKFFVKRQYFPQLADGTHLRSSRVYKEKDFLSRIIDKLYPSTKIMFSFSYLSSVYLRYFAVHDKRNLHCFIEHPKDVTEGTLLNIRSLKGLYESIHFIEIN